MANQPHEATVVKKKNKSASSNNGPVKGALPLSKALEKEAVPVAQVQENNNIATTEPNDIKQLPDIAPEKRESLGDKINKFFSKLKHNKAKNEQGAQSSTTPFNMETSELAKMVDVSSYGTSVNNPNGTPGLKLNLHNRSNQTIKNATVEVWY